jgi:hypothetical protein
MDETNMILPPNLDAALNEYYAGSLPDPSFATRLEAQLSQRQSGMVSTGQKSRFLFRIPRSSFIHALRARPFLSFLVAILALIALTGVAYALGRITGFIPGFGFTAGNGPVFVLAEPVETVSGDIRLRANQAVDDGERFWVELSANGLANDREDFSSAYLLLPNGEKIQFQYSGSSSSADGGTHLSYLFSSVAGQSQELTLLVEGLGGQDFSLPLRLRPVRAGEMALIPLGESSPLQSENHNGVRMVLEYIAVDSRKTVFQVSLRYDRPDTWQLAGPWSVTLSDEAGVPYPLDDITPDMLTSGNTHIYQTVPFTGNEELLLKLVTFPPSDTLPMFVDLSGDSPGFTFDPGVDPQTGQRWELNQKISAAGFDLKVVSATLTSEPALVFEVEPGVSVTGVMFRSSDPLMAGATGGVPVTNGNVTSSLTLTQIPKHPIEVHLMRIYYEAKGSWQIHWQPPAAPTPVADVITPTVAPTLSPLPTPTMATSDDPVLQEVQQLAQKFDAPLQQGAGWVHAVEETLTNPSPGQMFPPPYLKSEDWSEVDAEGYVLQSVHRDYNDSGQIIQQAATVGNYFVNFTSGNSGLNNGISYRLSLDKLSHNLSNAEKYGTSVLREESTCDNGRPCLVITGWENFPGPVQNPGETQAFLGAGQRTWVDLETGQQIKYQSFWLLADGGEAVTSTTSSLLVEKVDSPPQEILSLLSRVRLP